MTHTFNLNGRTIRIIVSDCGKKFKKSTGLSIEPALWNQKAKSLRAKCRDEKVYESLRKIDMRMQEAEDLGKLPDDAIDYALKGEQAKKEGRRRAVLRPTFWEYFKAWGERPSPVQRQRRLYPNIVSKLMGTNEDWEQIDSAYYFRLCRAMDDYGCSINYKGAIISKLKVVMNEGYKLKYHKSEEFRQFKRMSEVPETIALSSDELDRLWACKDLTQMESKARDLFMIGVYSVSRWEDYSRMSMANIANGMLNYEQLKTGKTVILPVSPRLLECLERNGGIAPSLSQQKFNEAIKRACKKIGMTERLHVSRSRGSARISESKERWELVSSHTARRTGATLLYLSGVPAKRVMLCTAHTTERVFLSYIKISREENARMLAGNAFFQ
jgi:integrase